MRSYNNICAGIHLDILDIHTIIVSTTISTYGLLQSLWLKVRWMVMVSPELWIPTFVTECSSPRPCLLLNSSSVSTFNIFYLFPSFAPSKSALNGEHTRGWIFKACKQCQSKNRHHRHHGDLNQLLEYEHLGLRRTQIRTGSVNNAQTTTLNKNNKYPKQNHKQRLDCTSSTRCANCDGVVNYTYGNSTPWTVYKYPHPASKENDNTHLSSLNRREHKVRHPLCTLPLQEWKSKCDRNLCQEKQEEICTWQK